ncbi:hypothetical protein ABB37_04245 [Leptomonas pyrrhocoris]|uniref:Uncharacterized protein n=1 Tax=Leptomonas pyrrhocoris TaxID=157538 RepID=A0A0M9G2H5_LEPPY|nr:hypothetical protein ABB37_04245 [Leptomonas pyrrhocoris]KPA80809.1 hypothetical protein ABB37_04245 [Leptomonas pyrrhocoris]|eukprot:XP_015659248.1 hypothetical protein ABB37_04245 [Leptomonas pyrrhocoris]
MSATWLQALRAYVSRKGPPSTLASRRRLYDNVAQTHLTVHRGERLRADGLAVLREARWALLRDGTTNEKADLLEHILESLAQASEIVTYEGSTSVRSSITSSSSSGTPSTQRISSPSSSPSQNLSERHQLLLEQVQCLVEAKVAEIPLTARHYRYPLRSPLLAEVSPELPLLLLDELARPPPVAAPPQAGKDARVRTPEWEAQVDCGASLAGAGHVREALALCGEDGRMFRAVLQRVARQRRDGWRRAWALAEAVPMERVIGVATPPSSAAASSSSGYSEDWLRGVLEAVQLRLRAAPPPPPRSNREDEQGGGADAARDDDGAQLFAWVNQVRELVMSPGATAASAAIEKIEARQAHALRRAQRLVMDTYLSACPPRRWREVVGVVLELKAARRRCLSPSSSTAEEKDAAEHGLENEAAEAKPADREGAHMYPVLRGDDDDDVVSAGRLLALLQFAQQPWMTLLFFYGNPLDLLAASALEQQRDARQKSMAWSVKDEDVQLVVEQLIRQAKEAGRLCVASGALLHARDVRHAAVYNHAMAGLASTGHMHDAMLFYDAMPVTCVNAYTHWGVLQIFLQPNSSHTVASALESAANYAGCLRALKRLVGLFSSSPAIRSAAASPSPPHVEADESGRSFTRDQANVWESMALWAALRRDADTALLCATHAPESCRYVHLIALIAAANENQLHAVSAILRQLGGSRRTTRKELCLAAAVVAAYFPLVRGGGDGAPPPTPATRPELASMYDDLTRVLGSSVGHQQTRMDEVVHLLIDYAVGVQRRRGVPVAPADAQTALQDVLVKANILSSTMDLVRLGRAPPEQQGNGHADDDRTTAVWRTVARLLQSIGSQQNLSVARAAPALVSAGVSAEVAIDLLPV